MHLNRQSSVLSLRPGSLRGLLRTGSLAVFAAPLLIAQPSAAGAALEWQLVPEASTIPEQPISRKAPLQHQTVSRQPARPQESGLRAQANRAAPAAEAVDPEQLRRELLLQPVAVGPEYSAPSLSPGVPSAFIAGWGDYFVGVSGATRGRVRDQVDGSLGIGIGIGDMAEAVALELSLNIASLNRFGSNGTFDAKLGRMLVSNPTFRLGASVGVVNVAEWGDDPKADPNPYGVLTAAWPLRPDDPQFTQTLQISAGAGGETFGFNGANAGGFASVGVELLPNVGISAGWSGRGGNAGLSWVPFKRTPLTLSVVGADLFNQTAEGPVAVFSLSWGSNFRTAQF